jgi:hypothetical protein
MAKGSCSAISCGPSKHFVPAVLSTSLMAVNPHRINVVDPDSKEDSLKSSSLIIPPDVSVTSVVEVSGVPAPSSHGEAESETSFPTAMSSPVTSAWDADDANSLFSEDEEVVRVSLGAADEGYVVNSDDDSFEIIEDSDSD